LLRAIYPGKNNDANARFTHAFRTPQRADGPDTS
jgi:hypothetical protein